jgi:hypothetical protein
MGETLENVAATLSTFKKEVGTLFEQVNQQFEQVNQRFEQVDKRFEALEKQVAAEGEKTRRHFDVVAEQMKAERNLVLDKGIATSDELTKFRASQGAEHTPLEKRLDNHEQRLKNLENR